jgi:hypothetical protein
MLIANSFTHAFRRTRRARSQLYKSFHEGSDTGLNELIAGVLAKPLPE